MKKDVSELIEGCLTCLRHRPLQRPITLKRTLQKPELLELLSIDCVGPRRWQNTEVYFICIVDHCSRFMMLEPNASKPTLKDIIKFIKYKWLIVFQTPLAILSDRSSEFTSAEFTNFLTNELGCAVVRTSPYYPQGNSINEASHRMVGNTLTFLEKDLHLTSEDALQTTAAIHNSSPHASTSCTQFFSMFGFEPVLPGWQGLQPQNKNPEFIRKVQQQERIKNVYRQLLNEEQQQSITKVIELNVGEWVIYLLSNYEQSKAHDTSKYSASWSLPAKIVEIKDKVVVLKTWDETSRQVPIAQIHKLRGSVNPLLEEMNYKEIIRVLPLKSATPSIEAAPEPWADFLDRQQIKQNTEIDNLVLKKMKRTQNNK